MVSRIMEKLSDFTGLWKQTVIELGIDPKPLESLPDDLE